MNSESTGKKEYSVMEIKEFLTLAQKKINDVQDISNTNKQWINEWVSNVGDEKEDIMLVEYNKDWIDKEWRAKEMVMCNNWQHNQTDLSGDKKDKKSVNVKEKENEIMEQIFVKIKMICAVSTNIPEKEAIINEFDSILFTHDNINNNVIHLPGIEKTLLSLLNTDQNHESYVESVCISLTLISLLMKRLITIEIMYPTYKSSEHSYNLTNYLTFFTEAFPRLFRTGEFHWRMCMINNIGMITQYYIYTCNEKLLWTLLQNSFSIYWEWIAVSRDDAITNDQNVPKKQGVNIDSTKSIIKEIVNKLKFSTPDIFPQCQNEIVKYTDDWIFLTWWNRKYEKNISLLLSIYEILGFILKLPFYAIYFKQNVWGKVQQSKFIEVIYSHFLIPSPQLQFWVINTLIALNDVIPLLSEKFFWDNILPSICLMRYLPVDGIQKNSMIWWKNIVGQSGVSIIKDNYECFLTVYIKHLSSISQGEREAACRCLQEIIIKVYDNTLHSKIWYKNYEQMLYSILKCCHDQCWNVRESGLIALGYVYGNINTYISHIIKPNIINDILQLIKLHWFENTIEVRDASAFALKVFLSNHGTLNEPFLSFYGKIFKNINSTWYMTNDIYPEVKKEVFAYITEKQDFGFMREMEFDEWIDGFIHLIKEMCVEKQCFLYKELGMRKDELMMIVVDDLCKNYNHGLTNLRKKTWWEAWTVWFGVVDKSEFEMYFDYIVDILIREWDEHLNSLSGFQAEKFVKELWNRNVVSKRMLKSKVINKIKGKIGVEEIFEKILK